GAASTRASGVTMPVSPYFRSFCRFPMHVLVTGPGGFLGRYIVEQLLARGDTVRGYARGDYPELRELGIELLQGDLADRARVLEAVAGVECVIHTAGKVGVWGRWFDYF